MTMGAGEREDSGVTVLQYVGYAHDGGGMLAALRALAGGGGFESVLGVAPGFVARRGPALPTLELPAIRAEQLGLATLWRSRRVARAVQAWLGADPHRIFHGHSRAGLLVALWLQRWGEARALATVHCLGRKRWLYRRAARHLGNRVFWLGPAMKQYYGTGANDWEQCLPDCVGADAWAEPAPRPRHPPAVTFGCAGALVPVKQWERVIDALARLPAGTPVAVVHAGGTDGTAASAAYAAALRRRAEARGVTARLQWCGEVTDMRRFYDTIDCLIVASPLEASSMAALEAGAAGVPVLASAAAGTRDLVEAARLGWVFAAEPAEALARAMTRLAAATELAAWRRDDAALRAFTAPVVAAKHAAVYRARVTSP